MKHRHHSARQWMIRSAVVLVLLAGILVAARLFGWGSPFAPIVISLGTILLILLGVFAVFRHYHTVLHQDDKPPLPHALRDEWWVQWTYSREQWRQITQESWAKAQRNSIQMLAISGDTLAGFALVVYLTSPTSLIPFIASLGALFGAIWLWYSFHDYRLYRKRRQHQQGYGSIGPLGISPARRAMNHSAA